MVVERVSVRDDLDGTAKCDGLGWSLSRQLPCCEMKKRMKRQRMTHHLQQYDEPEKARRAVVP